MGEEGFGPCIIRFPQFSHGIRAMTRIHGQEMPDFRLAQVITDRRRQFIFEKRDHRVFYRDLSFFYQEANSAAGKTF